MTEILNAAAYRNALEEISAKLGSIPRHSPEGERLSALVDAVEAWEAEHHPIGLPHPIAAIEEMLRQKGLSRRDLEAVMGSRGHVSDVLNRYRPLTLDMIRKLKAALDIPADVLIQEYELEHRSPAQARQREVASA